MEQYRFEKQLKLSKCLTRDTQNLARRQLFCVHKAWASWYIEQGNYHEAKQSLVTAAKYGLSPMLFVKRVGIRLAPSLLRWAVVRDKKKAVRYDRSSWHADQSVGTI